MNKIIAHIRLMRPANIVTAVADIMAGFAASGALIRVFQWHDGHWLTPHIVPLLWLCLSTVGLYGGGVVFNDVFDAKLDKVERPERPIPRGLATVSSAGTLAVLLLLLGVVAAWQVSFTSALIALAIAGLAVLYDAWGKHQLVFGPVNMGLCRGGNLLLGVSAIPSRIIDVWYIALIPIIYIAAITMISRGEVHGGNRKALQGGLYMYAFIILSIFALALAVREAWWEVIPFIVLLAYFNFPPLVQALRQQKPHLIGKAVKAGVLSLIVLNASLATTFANWAYGILVLMLLPFSIWLARRFAVT